MNLDLFLGFIRRQKIHPQICEFSIHTQQTATAEQLSQISAAAEKERDLCPQKKHASIIIGHHPSMHNKYTLTSFFLAL